MSLLRISVISGAALAASTICGLAADMPGNASVSLPLPPPTRTIRQIDESSGWYLRGDAAYRIGRTNGAEVAPGFGTPANQKMGDSIAAGVGAGIKSGWLRTDVTVDVATPMKYEATPGGTSAKVSASTFLANGYLDLGTWYRATPYIGVGAGAARMHISDYTSTVFPPLAGGDTSRNKWNFAYAGMAGIAYAVSSNTMVDLGYRYINLGDVTTGGDALGSMTLKKIAAHEVRVGIRWNFDDFPTR